MSIRLLQRFLRNGRNLLFTRNHIYHRKVHTYRNQKSAGAESLQKASILANEIRQIKSNSNLIRFSRRLFIDNVLNRVTNPVSSVLRAEATKKFAFGDSLPFFSLVGVSLASGSGVLTKDDELEGICWEIREAVSSYQTKLEEKVIDRSIGDNLKLENLEIGPPIAKGCNAVVYAAAFKDQSPSPKSSVPETKEPPVNLPIDRTFLSPITNFSRFTQNFGSSVDNLHHMSSPPNTNFTSGELSNYLNRTSFDDSEEVPATSNVKTVKFNENIEMRTRSNASIASSTFEAINDISLSDEPSNIYNYPWAIKMMFNYDIQSNAMAILRAMYKETLPARHRFERSDVQNWERMIMEQTIHLAPHPNIVLMPGYFCDQIPNLMHSNKLYPNALPARLNPDGYGRNMSLFMLMKRYDNNLRGFLELGDFEVRTRVILFAQLLEAVAHLNRSGVAHRDLKSDNILIDSSSDSLPILVLSDFGCCFADKKFGLRMPYPTDEIDKGGNQALMAPEIINRQPGTFALLNYTKSDLWACGTIAYEIFGYPNPFYGSTGNSMNPSSALRNVDYDEAMLPEMGQDVPFVVRKLVENMLQRSPSKRLSTEVAANVLELYLWGPSAWIKFGRNPTNNEILQWLLSLTTKVLCEGSLVANNLDYLDKSRRTYTEYILIATFLTRAKLKSLRQALNWIQSL